MSLTNLILREMNSFHVTVAILMSLTNLILGELNSFLVQKFVVLVRKTTITTTTTNMDSVHDVSDD